MCQNPGVQSVIHTAIGINADLAPIHDPVEGVFEVQNDWGMRKEIKVALEKLNGFVFRGTITPTGSYERNLQGLP